MRAACALAAAMLFLLAACAAPYPARAYEIYLVRHAEKTTGHPDPGLTRAGAERAQWLARWLSRRAVTAVWSSDYRRSRDTAAPAARGMGQPVRGYDPGNLQALAAQLLSHAENALVVGHSNTTPELAAILCECVVEPMSESDYERIIVVTVAGDSRRIRELDQASLRREAARG